jgi:hypothetical protein
MEVASRQPNPEEVIAQLILMNFNDVKGCKSSLDDLVSYANFCFDPISGFRSARAEYGHCLYSTNSAQCKQLRMIHKNSEMKN